MSIYSEVKAFIKAEQAARRAAKGTKEQRLAAHLQHVAESDERSKVLAPIAEAERKRKREEVHEALYREKQTAEHVKEHYHTINPDVVPAIGYTNNPKKKSHKKALRKLLRGSKRNLTLSHLFTPEALTELSAASGGWSWTSSNTAVATVAKTGTDTATSSTATATGVAAGTSTITATFNGTNDDGSLYSVSGSAQLTVTAAKNKLQSVSISPSTASGTAGTAFPSTVFTVVPNPADDGSCTYSWNSLSGTGAAGLTLSKNGSKATVSGTPTTAGTVTLSGFAKDSYGTQHGASATITIASTPSSKAHAKTATVSLSNTTATVNSAFTCNASLSNVQEPDDGSYTYTWFFSGPTNGTLAFNSTTSSTATISGTPATSGTVTVKCNIKDSYGTYATVTAGTITVNAAPSGMSLSGDTATIHAGTQSTYTTHGKPYSRNWWVTIANSSGGSVTDDGTLTYLWYWIDNTTGTGLVFDPDNEANIYIDGTPTKAGQAHMQCDITDIYGTTITAPSQGISIS